MTLIRGSCPLYSAPKACNPSPFLSPHACALLLHYLPWCIHWKWPYTSVNMSSHCWWHPKSLTSTPFPPLWETTAPMSSSTASVVIIHYPWQCQPMTEQAPLESDFYPYSRPRTCEREGMWWGEVGSFIIHWMVDSSSVSLPHFCSCCA